jgi:putative transposase
MIARPRLVYLKTSVYSLYMPAKNSRKTYVENGYYHIYNRGVEKRTIFLDQQDYGVFLSHLKEYLLPKEENELHKMLLNPNTSYKEKDKILKLLRLNNFNQDIFLLAYCLMPNHFHFFVKQKSLGAIDKFMNSLGTRYTMYFNRKYKRVGSLYQNVYRAVLVNNEKQFIYLSKYIHQQALALSENQPSSYLDYIGIRKTSWVNSEEILYYFSKTNPSFSYKKFILEPDNFAILKNLTLDET